MNKQKPINGKEQHVKTIKQYQTNIADLPDEAVPVATELLTEITRLRKLLQAIDRAADTITSYEAFYEYTMLQVAKRGDDA